MTRFAFSAAWVALAFTVAKGSPGRTSPGPHGCTYKPLLDQLGVTYTQYLVLNVLWEEDGQTVGAIAERLSLESSTVTPLVKRLEAASLVTRMRQHDDERRVLVSLTKSGRELRKKSGCLGERLLARSGMQPKELIGLTREVQRLRDALVRADAGSSDEANDPAVDARVEKS